MEGDWKTDKIIKIKIDCLEYKAVMEPKVLLAVMEFVRTAEELIKRKILRLLSSRSFKILIKEFN